MRRSIIVISLITFFTVLFFGLEGSEMNMEKVEFEIVEVEKQFAIMADKEGVGEAFLFYAADDAVLMRNNKIIKGKAEIKKYFDSVKLRNIKLKWSPDFVDVSSSGDMAYTWGSFTFSAENQSGESVNSKGIFHTVWKKQLDGKWKYVWD